jgi:general secretion pathway protein J
MMPAADPDAASLSGTADSLALVTELPMASGTTTPVSATLAVDAAHRLVLRWRPDPHTERLGPPVPLTSTTLIGGVSALELSYMPPGGGWTTSWHRHALPALIRIRVAFMPDSPRRWPDIVAAPVLRRP